MIPGGGAAGPTLPESIGAKVTLDVAEVLTAAQPKPRRDS